jgi:hypothetical protein
MLRHPSPPDQSPGGGMMGGPTMGPMTRIPHPINNHSPNQSNVAGNNQIIKTESMDLNKTAAAGGGARLYTAASPAAQQGFSSQQTAGFGFNGYGGAAPRPTLSPMSPHGGRLNISPGGPGLSPRDAAPPPNMSPHPGTIYAAQQQPASPATSPFQQGGSGTGPPYQYEYYSKQRGRPLSQGSAYSGTSREEEGGPGRGAGGAYLGAPEDKMSEGQSGETQAAFGGEENSGGLVNLVNIKKEPNSGEQQQQSGDNTFNKQPGDDTKLPSSNNNTTSRNSQQSEQGEEVNNSSTNNNSGTTNNKTVVKTERLEGFNYDEERVNSSQQQQASSMMDLDSIPELPEIPELKYEDDQHVVKEERMQQLHHHHQQQQQHLHHLQQQQHMLHMKYPGQHQQQQHAGSVSPEEESEEGTIGRVSVSDFLGGQEEKEDMYGDNMGWHMPGRDYL